MASDRLRHANYVGQSIKFNACDNTAEWDVYQCSLSYDTTNYLCASGTNKRSIKATATAGFTTHMTNYNFLSTDLAGCHGMLRVYIPEGSGGTSYLKLTSIHVQLIDSTGKNRTIYLNENGGGYQKIYPGWATYNFIVDDYYSQTAGFNPNAITRIYVWFSTSANPDTPSIVIDRLEFYKPLNSKGLVMIWFDAIYAGQWEALAYLQSKYITPATGKGKLTALVTSYSPFVGGSNRLTLAQLHALHNAGHTIGLYSYEWHSMTEAQKEARLITEQTWLYNNQFADGMRIMSQGGTVNMTNYDMTTLIPKYLDCVVSGGGYLSDGFNGVRGLYNPRLIFSSSWSSDAGLTTKIARTITSKGILSFGAPHCSNDAEIVLFKAALDLIVAEINNGNLIYVTPHELIYGVGSGL